MGDRVGDRDKFPRPFGDAPAKFLLDGHALGDVHDAPVGLQSHPGSVSLENTPLEHPGVSAVGPAKTIHHVPGLRLRIKDGGLKGSPDAAEIVGMGHARPEIGGMLGTFRIAEGRPVMPLPLQLL